MRNLLITMMASLSLMGLFGCREIKDPEKWSSRQLDKWFEKGEWRKGLNIEPDYSINRRAFAISYFKNKERWNKAFNFLKSNDFTKMELKRYEIDGENVYAPLSEYMSKNEEDARYEAHRKYIDIQYVVSGKEIIGIAPSSMQKDILQPYDDQKDVMFMNVTQENTFQALPDRFFIFFPEDLHRPGLKDGENSLVRKLVIKVKID